MPIRAANVSTIVAEKFNGQIRTVRLDVAAAGNTQILPAAPSPGRRIISVTISVGATATEVEVFRGTNRNANGVVFAGGNFAINGGVQDDHGIAGNGFFIPAGDVVTVWLSAANPVKFIIKYTNDVR